VETDKIRFPEQLLECSVVGAIFPFFVWRQASDIVVKDLHIEALRPEGHGLPDPPETDETEGASPDQLPRNRVGDHGIFHSPDREPVRLNDIRAAARRRAK